jgi:hypothetical protein
MKKKGKGTGGILRGTIRRGGTPQERVRIYLRRKHQKKSRGYKAYPYKDPYDAVGIFKIPMRAPWTQSANAAGGRSESRTRENLNVRFVGGGVGGRVLGHYVSSLLYPGRREYRRLAVKFERCPKK